MGKFVAIVGKSGTGKSTSYGEIPEIGMKGLNPKETCVINVSGKDLPFRKWKEKYKTGIKEGGNYVETSDSDTIVKAIKYISESRKDIKFIVVDDGQYIMSFEFLAKANERGYDKFAQIGNHMAAIILAAKEARSDLQIFFLWHPELDGKTEYKMKTVGNMVDNYITLEGMFPIVLYTTVEMGADKKLEYKFITNHNGQYPAKSPVGMFDLTIPNDLGLVVQKINEYYN